MTTVIYYQNKENPYKFIELHNDGHYHNSVKQFISKNGKHIVINPCYRMKKKALMDLLKDYEEIIYSPDALNHTRCKCRTQGTCFFVHTYCLVRAECVAAIVLP